MSPRFRIGELTLDTGRRLLLRGSNPIALGPLTYRLLLTLVEAAPNVVSHDELVRSIWGGRAVSPETISQRIKLLRDALADDPHNPRYIEGVRGQGYRLLPQVEVLPAESRSRDRHKWAKRIGLAVSLIAAAAVVFWIMTAPMDAVRGSTAIPARQGNSIAVLPFADLSPEQDQQYLADGIAEEILTLLSKATTLRVIARTSSFSFRGKDTDVTRIAEALRVTHVLEGSVRKAGDRIRVTVRLVDASDGSRLWSQSYDQRVGDILALQTDIARSVAVELEANLQNAADLAARPVNARAYELYLHGQQKLRLMSLEEAARYFDRTIAIDPEFIPGYYGLGVVYVLQIVDVRVAAAENRERLRDVVRRGLRLGPNDPGLLALSAQLARYDGDIPLAEEQFAIALQRDPANSVLRLVYPIFKLDQGRPDEALALDRRAIEIDPLNPLVYINIWASHMDLWNMEEAMAAAAHLRELMPPSDPWRGVATVITRWYLSGDLAGSKSHITAAVARLRAADTGINMMWLPQLYYFIDDLQTADALMELARPTARNADAIAVEAYRHLAHGDVQEARRLAVLALAAPKIWGGNDDDFILVRLATDQMIEGGEARRIVDFLEKLAPEYALYKSRKDIDPKDFWPAPVAVKSAFSSYPALYFPDYIRALRAVGDEAGAQQMLDHLEAVLAVRRQRGLFLEERHVAEALALRGRTEAALDALEKAERDRTIYHRWHLVLLHNEMFAGLRSHPRFLALVERIRSDMSRQRVELSRMSQ
jgi:TolB-like protein/DNA-binding winged helix-turn-helix (wHTH) protein